MFARTAIQRKEITKAGDAIQQQSYWTDPDLQAISSDSKPDSTHEAGIGKHESQWSGGDTYADVDELQEAREQVEPAYEPIDSSNAETLLELNCF